MFLLLDVVRQRPILLIMPARSETLVGGEKLHLFHLFYQVEIR
jgi:hypothetical protein